MLINNFPLKIFLNLENVLNSLLHSMKTTDSNPNYLYENDAQYSFQFWMDEFIHI
jgi:hypothetical protein